MLSNIKNAQKTVYQTSLEQYLESGLRIVAKQIKKEASLSSSKK